MPTFRPWSRRSSRTAFVLGGGGNLGAIQVGMLRALLDAGITADVVVGCSAGALNGAAFCAQPNAAGVRRLTDTWLGLADRPGGLMPSSRMPSPVQIIRKGESLHPNDDLRSSIEQFMGGISTFEELVIPFQCVATDIEATSEAWFDSGDLVEPMLASAALPAVFPSVMIGGRAYLDGGVVNNVPISRAIELGADRIVVCHVGLHGRPHKDIRRPIEAALLGYWIARNSRFGRDLAVVPDGVEVIVLPPGNRPTLRYDDFNQSAELIEQGYVRASEHLRTLDEETGGGRRSERFASEVRRVVDELRGRVASKRSGHVADPEIEPLAEAVDRAAESGDDVEPDASEVSPDAVSDR